MRRAGDKAGLGIEHPILQVAVYDGVESVNKIIELPQVMTTSRDVLASSPDTCPEQISWDYDRAEIRPMGRAASKSRRFWSA
jgi:hypothetical protein